MGDIKRRRKQYSKPRKAYDKTRIEAENEIVQKFGLKKKREIWKTESKVSAFRKRAKTLIPRSEDEKKKFFEKLQKIGFKVNSIADVLGLKTEDLLERRLQTFVVKKNLATTMNQARQLIVHKQVFVDGKAVNIPSFTVTTDLENKLSLKPRKVKAVKETVAVEETEEKE